MPLFYLAFAFVLGIFLGAAVPLPPVYWFTLAFLGLLLSILTLGLYHSDPERTFFARTLAFADWLPPSLGLSPLALPETLLIILPTLLVSAITLGAGRYQSIQPDLLNRAQIASHNDTGESVTVTGVLDTPPDVRDTYINLRVESEVIRLRDGVQRTPVEGLVLARVDPDEEWHYGDRVTLTGRLETPPVEEDFSYRDYLARQGVYAYFPFARAVFIEPGQGNAIKEAIFFVKERALETVYQLFPDPEASLISGILLGVETGIPPSVVDAFRDTGTAHIIAISGFNFAILTALFVSIFGRLFGTRPGALVAAIMILLYTILVGANAAVVRAAIMGGLAILARQTRRRQAALNTLLVTAGVMAFFDPFLPWDVSFQLSFFATLGLVLYAEPLTDLFVRFAARYLRISTIRKLAPPVGEFFLFTLAAQITTLPIVIFHFQRLSLISIIANPLILPVQPAVMILGGLAVLLEMVFPPLGQIVAAPTWVFVAYTVRVVELLGRIPAGVIVLGQVALPVVLLLYGILFGLTFVRFQVRPVFGKLATPFTLVLLTLVAALTWRTALSKPDGHLHLTLFDVGRGDALLVQTPGGRSVLIDGGPSTLRLSDALGRRIPLGQRGLDFLVVAAPFDDQIAAIPRIVERFPPMNVLWAGPPNISRSARTLGETLTEAQILVVPAEPGHMLDLGNGGTLKVLTTGPRGAILLLEWGNFRALLPIGADFESLEALHMGKTVGPVTALLLAESGFAPLNPSEWIKNLRPQIALLSVDAGNREGFPPPETLEALDGISLLRTDQNGWIHLMTDGEQLWAEVERK